MDDKVERRKDENANEDKVTLKKEIGLMSACAIIIGECVAGLVVMSWTFKVNWLSRWVSTLLSEVLFLPHLRSLLGFTRSETGFYPWFWF